MRNRKFSAFGRLAAQSIKKDAANPVVSRHGGDGRQKSKKLDSGS
jgi:hypothetical protein